MIYGAKKGQNQQQKPKIAKDDLVSTSYFKGLYGLAEGEIAGLADGGKSIRLDGTPIVNDNGQANFDGVTWDFRTGTLDQEHIAGFSAVENERNVGVELRHDKPYVQAINNVSLSAVRLRLNFNALREQKDNGDITGYAISYAIDVQTDGGAFSQVLSNTVRGKASQGFKKSHRIDLPKASKNWTIRVRRITRNRDSDLIADTVSIDAITEIIDAKLRYPATALLGLTYDATTFSNIAKIAVRLKGKLIKVPSNYDPTARTYSGLWDGTFKLAYSNNPAWVLYDICTHKRYGLGERLSNMVDKWRLYQIAQYCDEMVDDGKGGKEPRFAINVYIQKDDDAYKVIQNIASVFRGLSYWDGTQVIVDSDTPKDPVYTFSPANIVGGEFSYTGTRQRDRHTVVKAAWDNPDNDYKTEYELIRDEQGIAKYGIRMLDISVFGCTSQAQAQRAGLWALKSEQLETRTVSFKTGLQGFIPQVGQIINIADNVFAGRAISGRVVSHNAQTVTLDRMAGKVGDSIVIGKETAKITRVDGQVITTDKALTISDDAVWAVISDDLKLMQFRILTIAQNDDATFSITALQYERQKYDAIDYGAQIAPAPITALKATPIQAPASVTIGQSVRTHQNQSVTTMTINWTQVQGAVAYQVRWRKDDGNWQNVPKMGGQSVDIDGVYSGNYIAEVQAIDAFDNESLATTSQLTQITGKVGKPPRPARLYAKGGLFSMELGWIFNAGSDDTNYTEIEVSPDGRSNIATLGTFAYPTDKHTINGLQGNLTQFYRARIVDKLGNVSDWTAWTSGTTEARADKVLSLLTGQITASQLHQDLSTPIGKIGTLENSLSTAKIDLSALNASMTTAKADIAKAKTDLSTAVSNITTERNRISAAIADITALQSANNAKTLELANLTQTVGGHTSSIRDLAVTTGELSQRYTQLKTASDNANSEITAIKQTQAGQATSIQRMSADIDANTARITAEQQARINTDNALSQRITAIDTAYKSADTQANAKIATLEQSVTDKDSAMARRVDTLQANYNTLNSTKASTASVTAETQARSTADNALSQRIDNLNSDYQSNKASVTSQLRTLSDADSATAQRLDAMSSKYDSLSVGGRNYLSKTRSGAWRDGTWQDYRFVISDKNLAGAAFTRAEAIEQGADVVFSFKIAKKSGRITSIGGHTHSLNHHQIYIDGILVGNDFNAGVAYPDDLAVHHIVIKAKDHFATATNDKALYIQPNRGSNGYADVYSCEIWDCKLEKGTVATDWTPALEDVDAQFVQTNANISTLQQTVTNADNALSRRIDALDASYKSADNALNASITAEQQARASADTALSQRISQLDSAYKSADSALSSRVATAEQSISSANQAIAQTQQTLTARIDGLAAGGRNLLLDSAGAYSSTAYSTRYALSQAPAVGDDVVITLWGELGTDRTDIGVYNTQGYNEIAKLVKIADGVYQGRGKWQKPMNGTTPRTPNDTHLNVYFYPNGATSLCRIDKIKLEKGNVATDWSPAPEDVDSATSAVQANLDEFKRTEAQANNALSQRIDSLNTSLGTKANAAALNDLSTKVNQVDGKINAEAKKVSTLQTTVNGQTASIQQHSQSINGLSAQWTLKAESNGIVSGIGLASSNGVSDFAVRANKFYVVPPTGTAKTPLFTVLTTTTTVGGVSAPAGVYLRDGYIQNGTITNAKIANGAITTAKIGNAQIGNAQIGNGAITTAKIGTAQVDTLQIAGEAVIVPRVQFTESMQEFWDIDTEVEINRITLDAQGGAVAIDFSFEQLYAKIGSRGNNPTIYMRIKRGVAVVRTLGFKPSDRPTGVSVYEAGNDRTGYRTEAKLTYAADDFLERYVALPTIIDNPPAGMQTYTVTLESRGLNAGRAAGQQAFYPVQITARSLRAMAVKR